MVATIPGLKNQGGCTDLSKEDIKSLEIGLKNLEQHITNIKNFGVRVVVTNNVFDTDTIKHIKLNMPLIKNIYRSLEEEFSSDERQQIMDLIEKKGFSADTADQKEYRKMYQFLMRRGFKGADIMAVMRESSQTYCEL